MSLPRDSYLETSVLTATPQRLRLMLIDGVIRHARDARRLFLTAQWSPACDALDRALNIVNELLTSIDRERLTDVTNKVFDLYTFIYWRLAEGGLNRDARLLDEALGILEIEQQTWRKICEQLAATSVPSPHLLPRVAIPEVAADLPVGGFSIEA